MKNTYTNKAIRKYGFEDPRTITFATLEEQGNIELAKSLWEALNQEEEEAEKEVEWEEPDWDDLECGFDPYEGCYTYDC